MSNSACLNGGALLFLTTFTRGRVPTRPAPALSVSMRRASSPVEPENIRALPPRAVLERLDAADVEPDGRVELERLATGRRLGAAEEDADLLAQLVDEDRGRAGLAEGAGDLAQGLAHQPGLQADVRVAHLALDLR